MLRNTSNYRSRSMKSCTNTVPSDKHFQQSVRQYFQSRAEVRRSFITTTVRDESHVTPQGRVRTGDQRLPVLCHCQLGQDIPIQIKVVSLLLEYISFDHLICVIRPTPPFPYGFHFRNFSYGNSFRSLVQMLRAILPSTIKPVKSYKLHLLFS